MLFKIAFRNILRNRRRSAMTGLAVAVGATALLVFGAFTAYLFAGFQTQVVQRSGHLTIFHTGYFLFGAGNPAAYGIGGYQDVMGLIGNDPVLRPLINVMTPSLTLFGIAGNFEADTSKTFFGSGTVPSDRERMRQWNEYGSGRPYEPDTRLSDDDPTRGLIGVGLARILGVCDKLAIANCPPLPKPPADSAAAPLAGSDATEDFSGLVERDATVDADAKNGMPRIDLLAATAGGAPNIVSLYLSGAEPQSAKELDDNYIGMHLALAQQLVYGRGEHKATGIVLQLHRTEDMDVARARLAALFKEHALDLEARDFTELNPFYKQTLSLFSAIFLFVTIIMGVIVLFTVVNTMTMTVMERTNEIGTSRAMGVRRRGIRWQFLIEGWLLGALGATAGVILSAVIAMLVNRSGLTWLPPGNTAAIPLRLDLYSSLSLILDTWIGLVLVATVAALIPANRAAKLPIVEALRHV